MSFNRNKTAVALFAMVLTALMAQVASAGASTITIGSVLPQGFKSQPFGQVQTQFNTTLPEKGANLTSPVDGLVVRWRVQGAVGGPFSLRVLHPNGSGAYEATQLSNPAMPTGAGLQTFSTSLPIKSGDLVGIDPTNATDEVGVATVAGATFAAIFPSPFNGATSAPSGTESGKELELSAEVQPQPKVTSLVGFSGSIAGGTKVTIKGESLTGSSEVKFGTLPAATFTVDSDTEITAVSPKSTKAGYVDVSVKSAAGTSPTVRADRFQYEACVVPKLKGLKLSAAKKALKRADCKLGKVKGPEKGLVKTQNPKAGKVKLPGSKVGVKLQLASKKTKK